MRQITDKYGYACCNIPDLLASQDPRADALLVVTEDATAVHVGPVMEMVHTQLYGYSGLEDLRDALARGDKRLCDSTGKWVELPVFGWPKPRRVMFGKRILSWDSSRILVGDDAGSLEIIDAEVQPWMM
jgi:hypothetical protein